MPSSPYHACCFMSPRMSSELLTQGGLEHLAVVVFRETVDKEVGSQPVYAPASDDLLYAAKGQGAFANGAPLTVSSIADLAQATLLHGSLNLWLHNGYWEGFMRLVRATSRQRGFGDDFAHTFVCRGQAEVMLESDVKPWDLAPLKILVEEAGGRFSDLTGAATIYSGNAVVSNGRVHDAVVELLGTKAT